MADAADFDRQMAAQNARGEEILWHEVPNENILVEGLGFFAEERRWNRLPQSLSGMLQAQRPALIELSSHMAGACLRFRTDSRAVWVKAAVNAAPYMAHMTPAAQCGCDCYLRALPDMAWQFAGLTKFSPQEDSFCCELARDLPPHTEVLVYLPLYIGIRSIAIGLEKGGADAAGIAPQTSQDHRLLWHFHHPGRLCLPAGYGVSGHFVPGTGPGSVQFGVFGQWRGNVRSGFLLLQPAPAGGAGGGHPAQRRPPGAAGNQPASLSECGARLCAAAAGFGAFGKLADKMRLEQHRSGTVCAGRAFSAAGGGTPEIPGR